MTKEIRTSPLRLPTEGELKKPHVLQQTLAKVSKARANILRIDTSERHKELALCAHCALFVQKHPKFYMELRGKSGKRPPETVTTNDALRAVLSHYVASEDPKKRQKDSSHFARILTGPLSALGTALKVYQALEQRKMSGLKEDYFRSSKVPIKTPKPFKRNVSKLNIDAKSGGYFVGEYVEEGVQSIVIDVPDAGYLHVAVFLEGEIPAATAPFQKIADLDEDVRDWMRSFPASSTAE